MDSSGLDPKAAGPPHSPTGGGGDVTAKEAANLRRDNRRLKRELYGALRSAGRALPASAAFAADDDGNTPTGVQTRNPLGMTPNVAERRSATKHRARAPTRQSRPSPAT